MFQDYALFPHMTVADNVGYGLKVRRVARAERRQQVDDVLRMVRLDGYGDRKPIQLSGGQRQRVALARAIVNRPKVLLLDEPLGALDLKLRQEMQVFLKSLQRELGMTFVYVTHDQEEALTMSDHVAVFNGGRIEQVGSPTEVYERPATAFVAGFVGTSNLLERAGRRFSVRPERIQLTRFRRAGDGRRRDLRRLLHPDSRRHGLRRPAHGRPAERRPPRRTRGPRPRRLARRGRIRDRIHRAGGQMSKSTWAVVAVLAAALAFPAAGVTKAHGGTLNMIAWEGYLQKQWVQPFVKSTGCTIHPKYAGSSDEMVTLMRSGGGGQYDMVSASGDASLRLIYGKDVQAVDPAKVPDFKNFGKAFRSPPNNTVGGKHYGISLQWGPNTLMYNTKQVKPAPTSWASIYSTKYKGKITVPDNPIQIADAALYLMKHQRSLGIKDPYELNSKQFGAAINLLKKQKPLIKKYWALASDEIDLFKNGDAVIGASWPYQTNTLIAAKAPVKDTVPKEGATGWLDTWMVSSKTKNLDCAYKWLAYVSTPKVQAEQAIYFGETPVNSKACKIMNTLSKGSCAQYHANAPLKYFKQIYFWKTPIADCGNGKKDCMDYTKWQQAWTQLKG